MASEDRSAVEARLKARSDELRRLRVALREDTGAGLDGELSHLDNHPGDQGTETHDRELEVGTEIQLEEEELRIRDALQALADGSYGRCHDCGREIPGARLEAQPEAIRCLDCQRRAEGAHRQRSVRA